MAYTEEALPRTTSIEILSISQRVSLSSSVWAEISLLSLRRNDRVESLTTPVVSKATDSNYYRPARLSYMSRFRISARFTAESAVIADSITADAENDQHKLSPSTNCAPD